MAVNPPARKRESLPWRSIYLRTVAGKLRDSHSGRARSPEHRLAVKPPARERESMPWRSIHPLANARARLGGQSISARSWASSVAVNPPARGQRSSAGRSFRSARGHRSIAGRSFRLLAVTGAPLGGHSVCSRSMERRGAVIPSARCRKACSSRLSGRSRSSSSPTGHGPPSPIPRAIDRSRTTSVATGALPVGTSYKPSTSIRTTRSPATASSTPFASPAKATWFASPAVLPPGPSPMGTLSTISRS